MSNSFKPRIQHLRGDVLALQAIGSTFTPLDGEIILEKQNDGYYLQKIGNGKDLYKDLPYGGVATGTDVDLSNYYTKEETDSALSNMESDVNKVQEINETATEEQYPSARAVAEAINTVYDDFGTAINVSYIVQLGNDGIYILPLTNIQTIEMANKYWLNFNDKVVIEVSKSLDLQAIGFVKNKKYRIEIRNKKVVSLKSFDEIVDKNYNPESENAQSGKAVAEAVSDKQDSLVSGTNIKTINNQSILGSGNITIEGGSAVEVDQTYNPESTNAQSGKAVAQAIADSDINIYNLPYTEIVKNNSKKFTINCYNLQPNTTYSIHLYTQQKHRGACCKPYRHPSNETFEVTNKEGITNLAYGQWMGYKNLAGKQTPIRGGNGSTTEYGTYSDVIPAWMTRGGVLQTEWTFTTEENETIHKETINLNPWILDWLRPKITSDNNDMWYLISESQTGSARETKRMQFRLVDSNGMNYECKNRLELGQVVYNPNSSSDKKIQVLYSSVK